MTRMQFKDVRNGTPTTTTGDQWITQDAGHAWTKVLRKLKGDFSILRTWEGSWNFKIQFQESSKALKCLGSDLG